MNARFHPKNRVNSGADPPLSRRVGELGIEGTPRSGVPYAAKRSASVHELALRTLGGRRARPRTSAENGQQLHRRGDVSMDAAQLRNCRRAGATPCAARS